RVLKEEENFYQNSELVIEETEVKEHIVKHFEKQFRERKHKFENLNKEWEEEYRAKSWINPSWYQKILDPIQEEEWLAALNKVYNKTALDVSGIGYILLKKVFVETTK
ncbi:15799_t:CDS:1, partial [Gigaspora margarita]